MDKNELNEALNELSGRVAVISRGIGSERNAHDLELLNRSLQRSSEELTSIINVLTNKQL